MSLSQTEPDMSRTSAYKECCMPQQYPIPLTTQRDSAGAAGRVWGNRGKDIEMKGTGQGILVVMKVLAGWLDVEFR